MNARHVFLAIPAAALLAAAAPSDTPQQGRACAARASDWLALLPEGETKRAFLLDCTGCHQFDSIRALPGGSPRTAAQWTEATARMLSYAGATTGFPVIAHDRDPAATGAWLAQHLGARPAPRQTCDRPMPRGAEVTEYLMPQPQDLPHDIAIDSNDQVIVTGMFTHVLYTLDQASGRFSEVAIPVARANPRALDLDENGAWWAVLGNPRKLARYTPATRSWQDFDVGMYAHSLAPDMHGRVWFNGHFTKDPEQMGFVDRAGAVTLLDIPRHPTLAAVPGGPIPYEIRGKPDGSMMWMSELQGNRMIGYDPGRRSFAVHELPLPRSGPRRHDVDARGILWIPAYSAGSLLRFDPARGSFETIPLPVPDALPYVVRIDHGTGIVWIGTGAADAIFSFDPATRRFTEYPLPTTGAMIRHLAINPRSHEVWAAYGASPGIPARIARLRPR